MNSVNGTPHVVVTVDRRATSARVLRAAATFAGVGLLETKRRILAGEPVVDEEMFSNVWFDERAGMLLTLLTNWQDEGIAFEVREVSESDDGAAGALISLDVLRKTSSSRRTTPR